MILYELLLHCCCSPHSLQEKEANQSLLKDLEEEKSKVASLQHKLDSCKEDTEDAQVGDLFGMLD